MTVLPTGSTYLSYDSSNSLALQAMTARGAHGQVVVNAQSVINDTSAKMTCVVDDLCGCPFNQRLMTYGHWPG